MAVTDGSTANNDVLQRIDASLDDLVIPEDKQHLADHAKAMAGLILTNRLSDVATGEFDVTRILEIGADDTDVAIIGKRAKAAEFFAKFEELKPQRRYQFSGERIYMDHLGLISIGGLGIEILYKFTDYPFTGKAGINTRNKLAGSPYVYRGTMWQNGRAKPAIRAQWHSLFAVKEEVPTGMLRINPNDDEINPAVFKAIEALREDQDRLSFAAEARATLEEQLEDNTPEE